jgi:hypothetical protein
MVKDNIFPLKIYQKVILDSGDKLSYKFLEKSFPRKFIFFPEHHRNITEKFQERLFRYKLTKIYENRLFYVEEFRKRKTLNMKRKRELKTLLVKEIKKLISKGYSEEKREIILLKLKKEVINKNEMDDLSTGWIKTKEKITSLNLAGKYFLLSHIKASRDKNSLIDFFLLFQEKFPLLKHYVMYLYKNLIKKISNDNPLEKFIITSFLPKLSKIVPTFGYLNRVSEEKY